MKQFSLIITLIFSLSTLALPSNEAECNALQGHSWDANLGCLAPSSIVDTREDSNACQGLSGNALKDCMKKVAQDQADGLEAQHKNGMAHGDGARIGVALLMSAVTGYVSIKYSSQLNSCAKPSIYMLTGGAVAALTAEITARIKYKNKLKKSKEKYEREVSDAASDLSEEEKVAHNSTNQEKAFQYMIEIQQARESAERVRRTGYTISAAAYAGAALLAIYEMASTWTTAGTGANCKISSIDNQKNIPIDILPQYKDYHYLKNISYAEFTEILKRSGQFLMNTFIPTAYSQKVKYTSAENMSASDVAQINSMPLPKGTVLREMEEVLDEITITSSKKQVQSISSLKQKGVSNIKTDVNIDTKLQGRNPVVSKAEDKVKKLIEKAWFRASFATVLGTYSTILRNSANKNIDISRKRIGQLRDILATFKSTGGLNFSRCTPNDREDSKKPACYCYLADGSQNLSRKKLVICNEIWGSNQLSGINNYNNPTGNAANLSQGCVTKSHQADITCACKTNNSCLKKVPGITFGGGAIGWANSLGKVVNSATNGGLTNGKVNESSLNKQAATIKKQIDKLAKDPKYKSAIAKIRATEKKMSKAFNKQYGSSTTSSPLGALSAPAPSIADIKKNPKKAIESLKKSVSSTGKWRGTKGKKKGNFDIDFGDSESAGIEIDNDVAQVMDKEFKIKGDINNNPDNNIFKILSNRYHSTGVKRLFEKK